jgi:hypothetical protein
MSTGFVNSTAAAQLDSFINGISPYVVLYTVAPGEDGTGGTEANYTGYARVNVTNTAWLSATVANPSIKANSGLVTYPTCSAGTNTITSFAICNGVAGSPLFRGDFTSNLIVSTGIIPEIAIGALQLKTRPV